MFGRHGLHPWKRHYTGFSLHVPPKPLQKAAEAAVGRRRFEWRKTALREERETSFGGWLGDSRAALLKRPGLRRRRGRGAALAKLRKRRGEDAAQDAAGVKARGDGQQRVENQPRLPVERRATLYAGCFALR